MNIKKAQLTTEYITILAVILIISLVVVVFFNIFPSFNFSSSLKITKELWEDSKPISVKEAFYKTSSLRMYLFLESKAEENITINSIFVDGKKLAFFYYNQTNFEGVGSALCNSFSCLNFDCNCNLVLSPFSNATIVFEKYDFAQNCTASFFETKIGFNYSIANFSNLNYSPPFALQLICTN